MSPGRSVVGVSLVLALAVGACASKGGQNQRAPEDPDAYEAKGGDLERILGSDDLDALDAELRAAQVKLEQETRGESSLDVTSEVEQGEPVTGSVQPGPTPATSPPLTRCERIAALSGRICQLRDRMCALASEHADEPRYAEACERAEQTCEQAQQAADGCAAA